MENQTCPKCNGKMEKGILTPQTEGGFVALLWAAKIKFAGIFAGEHKETATYRCEQCGYLETYAK